MAVGGAHTHLRLRQDMPLTETYQKAEEVGQEVS